MDEDGKLIALIKEGDTEAFGGIIERYQAPVLRCLYRLTGSYDLALDLRQDTFLKAYDGIMKADIHTSFRAWLYRIAVNAARQQFRRQRILTFVPFLDKHERAGDDPTPALDERALVQETLVKLPPKQRACILLHHVEGFTYREIAETLETTEEAVRKHVARGSLKFRQFYAGGEVD